MHLLQTSSATLDDIVEPVDLGQTPGDIVVLSFVDTDLAGLSAAYQAEREALPSVRLAHLRDLRHPMSLDLWIDSAARHAKVIVVRLLGGLDWWRYGVERLSETARASGIALAVLPGEDRESLAETKAFLERVPLDDMDFTIFSPYPGSPIYEDPDGYDIQWENATATYYKADPAKYACGVSTTALAGWELLNARRHLESRFKRWR